VRRGELSPKIPVQATAVDASLPPPRKHLVRYHGYCSSAARDAGESETGTVSTTPRRKSSQLYLQPLRQRIG
jgi:hypothetical protein